MSGVYTPTATRSTTFTAVADGDALTAASVRVWLEALADKAAFVERSKVSSLNPIRINDMVVNAGGVLQGSATTAPAVTCPIYPDDGRTLDSVALYFKIASGHGGVPASRAALSVFRRNVLTGAVGQALNSGDAGSGLFISPGTSVAAYEQSSAVVSYTYTCDQNNVIDLSTYQYFVALFDETGANSQTGNLFYGLKMTESA